MTHVLLSYAEAAEQVQLFIHAMGSDGGLLAGEARRIERVPLEQALGRVLAEGIVADRDLPPFARSTRDGFACRAVEANSHQLLHLTKQVRAGEAVTGKVGRGEIWEIMTGAPVPAGADAVFMVEHAEVDSEFVRLIESRRIETGVNIVPRGAEGRAGDLLLGAGARVGPAQIALAAQCGYATLPVTAQPRVAILSTGDELVAIDDVPAASQIRNSNSPMLAALVTAAGGVPVVLPVVADDVESVNGAIRQARSAAVAADLILFTGGISAGRFDLIEGGLEEAGARFFFGGVAMQPGKPVVFGQLPPMDESVKPDNVSKSRPVLSVPFFALPGNPISSAVTFLLFAAPLVAALGNDDGTAPRFGLARIAAEWRGRPGLTRFLPAWCDFALEPTVRLVPWQGSGDVAAFARANCFVVSPAETGLIAAGRVVSILMI